MLKKIIKKVGMLHSVIYKNTIDDTDKKDTKTKIRYEIENEVFDELDSIADNAKMISLLMSTISRMYEIMDDVNKDKLTPESRYVIEHTFAKFKTTDTRADVMVEKEGVTSIDKLLDRQGNIGTIIKEKYKD